MKVIAVIPVYNEEDTLEQLINKVSKYVNEIFLVDDGSVDNTWKILRKLKKHTNINLTIGRFPKNKGMSAALAAGLALVAEKVEAGKLSKNDIIVNIDADLQHRPCDIPALVIYMLKRNHEICITRRNLKCYPAFKKIGNFFLSLTASLIGNFKFKDIECGFRAIKAGIVSKILAYFTGYKYSCAQEIGIISSLLGYNLDNSFNTNINYYRDRAGIKDGFINLLFSIIAFVRVKFNIKQNYKLFLKELIIE